MTTSTFIEKFNWRLLVIHFLATGFIMLAAKRFSVLTDIDLFNALWRYGKEDFLNHLQKTDMTVGQRVTYTALWTNLSAVIGLFIAFIISLTICIRKKIFWVNSIIVLLLAFSINRLGLLDISVIKTITASVGNLFINSGVQYASALNGGLLTIIGLFIFLNKWTNKFILKQTVTA